MLLLAKSRKYGVQELIKQFTNPSYCIMLKYIKKRKFCAIFILENIIIPKKYTILSFIYSPTILEALVLYFSVKLEFLAFKKSSRKSADNAFNTDDKVLKKKSYAII